jgi:hypothetical protein
MKKSLFALSFLLACVAASAAPKADPIVEWESFVGKLVEGGKSCKPPKGFPAKVTSVKPYKEGGPGYFVLDTDSDDGGAVTAKFAVAPTKAQIDAVKGKTICLR